MDRLASIWFRTLSTLQVKPRYPLDGSAPCVSPSPSVVGRCASVWSYCLVHSSGDVNCCLPHYVMFLSVDSGRCRRFLSLIVGAPGCTAPAPPRGTVVDFLQLGGSRSQTSGNAFQVPL
jgi:hypothetical protein